MKPEIINLPVQPWMRWTNIVPDAMNRLPVVPRNRQNNWYLHLWWGQDDRSLGLHDHPWDSISITLWGRLQELVFSRELPPLPKITEAQLDSDWWSKVRPVNSNADFLKTRLVDIPRIKYRSAEYAHAVVTPRGTKALTLFITWRRRRKWGFYTPLGWVPHDLIHRAIEVWAKAGYEFAQKILESAQYKAKREFNLQNDSVEATDQMG